MSMISELLDKLRKYATEYNLPPFGREIDGTVELLEQAAETIETLSAKLSAANMERSQAYYGGGWISCKDRLPEEKINPITKDFYEYQVTFQSEDVKDVRHYKFGNGHWWNCGQNMDKYVTAWRLPIEPYQGE